MQIPGKRKPRKDRGVSISVLDIERRLKEIQQYHANPEQKMPVMFDSNSLEVKVDWPKKFVR